MKVSFKVTKLKRNPSVSMGKHRRKEKEATSRHKLSKSSRFEAAWDGSHATSDSDSLQNDGETQGTLKL